MDLRRWYLTRRHGRNLYGFLRAITNGPGADRAYRLAIDLAPLRRAELYEEAYAAVSRLHRPDGPMGELALHKRALLVLRVTRGFSWAECSRVLGMPEDTLIDDYWAARKELEKLVGGGKPWVWTVTAGRAQVPQPSVRAAGPAQGSEKPN